MPLRHRVAAGGLIGAELRVARALHPLEGSGQSARLAQLLPAGMVRVLTHHADGSAASIEIAYLLAVWLTYAALLGSDALRAIPFLEQIVGPERLGSALDAALLTITGASVRHPSVLRAQILRAATIARRTSPGPYTVVGADMLVVGGAADDAECAALAVVIATPPQAPGWLRAVTYEMLLTPDGDLGVICELEQAMWPRFLANTRSVAGSAMGRAAALVWGALSADERTILNAIDPAGQAAEVCSSLLMLLPTQPQLVDWARTPAAAAIAFNRALLRCAPSVGYWIMDYGSRRADYGLWIMDYG